MYTCKEEIIKNLNAAVENLDKVNFVLREMKIFTTEELTISFSYRARVNILIRDIYQLRADFESWK